MPEAGLCAIFVRAKVASDVVLCDAQIRLVVDEICPQRKNVIIASDFCRANPFLLITAILVK